VHDVWIQCLKVALQNVARAPLRRYALQYTDVLSHTNVYQKHLCSILTSCCMHMYIQKQLFGDTPCSVLTSCCMHMYIQRHLFEDKPYKKLTSWRIHNYISKAPLWRYALRCPAVLLRTEVCSNALGITIQCTWCTMHLVYNVQHTTIQCTWYNIPCIWYNVPCYLVYNNPMHLV
jgi:hypothetical protein